VTSRTERPVDSVLVRALALSRSPEELWLLAQAIAREAALKEKGRLNERVTICDPLTSLQGGDETKGSSEPIEPPPWVTRKRYS